MLLQPGEDEQFVSYEVLVACLAKVIETWCEGVCVGGCDLARFSSLSFHGLDWTGGGREGGRELGVKSWRSARLHDGPCTRLYVSHGTLLRPMCGDEITRAMLFQSQLRDRAVTLTGPDTCALMPCSEM